MKKTILITGATDGIGLESAKTLVKQGHHVLVHGRNQEKLENVVSELSKLSGTARSGTARIDSFIGDLSRMSEVENLAKSVAEAHTQLDVLINNAGIYSTKNTQTETGMDVRFVVNTIAPYVLTQRLLPLLGKDGRVVNVSSAAQAPVDLNAFAGKARLSHEAAYAQSKLALTMWSRAIALELGEDGPAIIAVNPGSLLGSKMVKETYGIDGGDIRIGADILVRAALSDEFGSATGRYFDNDSGQFASPHPDALNAHKSDQIMQAIESILATQHVEVP